MVRTVKEIIWYQRYKLFSIHKNLYGNKHISIESITVRAYLLKALRNNLFNKLVGLERERDSLDVSLFEIPTDEDLFEQMFPQTDHDFTLAQHLLKAIAQLPPPPEDGTLPEVRQRAFTQENSSHHGHQRTVIHEFDQSRPAETTVSNEKRKH